MQGRGIWQFSVYGKRWPVRLLQTSQSRIEIRGIWTIGFSSTYPHWAKIPVWEDFLGRLSRGGDGALRLL
jgi:hypothetical protein